MLLPLIIMTRRIRRSATGTFKSPDPKRSNPVRKGPDPAQSQPKTPT